MKKGKLKINNNPDQRIIFILGPTAVGKTEIAIALAQTLQAEIVSCDSMQVYKEISIATSKPTAAMLKKVPHHLINIVSVRDEFDVGTYNQTALAAIRDIHARSKIPLVVGGSGLYMSILLDGIFEGGDRDIGIREALKYQAEQEGLGSLYRELAEVDLDSAQAIHRNDEKRIIRALEVYRRTRQPLSRLKKNRKGLWDTCVIDLLALNRDRARLYERINQRVEVMFEQGIIEEIEALQGISLSSTARAIIGITEIQKLLSGVLSLAEAKAMMKQNTRRLAKRQLTWFRHEQRLHWIDLKESEDLKTITQDIMNILTNRKTT